MHNRRPTFYQKGGQDCLKKAWGRLCNTIKNLTTGKKGSTLHESDVDVADGMIEDIYKLVRESNDVKSSTEQNETVQGGITDDLQWLRTNKLIDSETTSSHNVWYYGVVDVVQGYRRGLLGSSLTPNTGSLIVKLDLNGNLEYSVIYKIDSNIYVGDLPSKHGKYCMDFMDANQPWFRSAEFLIAHLIEEDSLQQVSLDWLINNVPL